MAGNWNAKSLVERYQSGSTNKILAMYKLWIALSGIRIFVSLQWDFASTFFDPPPMANCSDLRRERLTQFKDGVAKLARSVTEREK